MQLIHTMIFISGITIIKIFFLGMHEVTMKLSNKFSTTPVTRTQQVDSQRPLSGLKLSVNPPDASTTEAVTIEAKISGGTFVDLMWEFGDGRTKREFLRGKNNIYYYGNCNIEYFSESIF